MEKFVDWIFAVNLTSDSAFNILINFEVCTVQ